MKRGVDLFSSACAILFLSPLLFLCAAAVALGSRGPILFRQKRLGLHGRPFTLWKFRSMYGNAPDLRNPDGSAQTLERDARITAAGKFLRKASLDELPQFFNVLAGDMSLVGPRPDLVDQIGFYTEREKRKLSVRPGITGLAQISGRNNISWERRKSLDVEYVERQSFWLDLRILARTIPYALLGKDIHTDGANASRHVTTSH